MTKTFLSIAISFAYSITAYSQNTFPATGPVGIGTTTPAVSSLLEIKSTSKGILIPRMTKAQRDAIAAPATGLMIYQTNNTPGFYYYSGTAWTAISSQGANTALSNLKSSTAINEDLLPDTSTTLNLGSISKPWKDIYVGGKYYLDGVPYLSNNNYPDITFVGNAGNALTKSYGLTAVGYRSLYSNTTGNYNTANGYSALYSNTVGYSNVAIGVNALYLNTNRSNLVAVGDSALYNNGTGASFYFDATNNTAVGSKSLFKNTTGSYNTAYGANSLFSNTTGSNNIAVGESSLYDNTTGGANTAVGDGAMRRNKTGVYNTAYGFRALEVDTAGSWNTAIGSSALSTTYGNRNTAIGMRALEWTSGNDNTALGYKALSDNANNNNNNTAIGSSTEVSRYPISNSTVIGYLASVNANNKVVIGNSAVSVIGGYAPGGWSILSDARFKKDIKVNVPGLAFINKLKPVTYHLEARKFEKFLGRHDSVVNKMKDAYDKAEGTLRTGFIAQEVEATAKEINYAFDGVHHPESEHDNYSLAYDVFVVPLVKAVQELSSENDSLKSVISDIQSEISGLKSLMLSGNNNSSITGKGVTVNQQTGLGQNIPNPFNHTTTINYTLPQSHNGGTSAKIIITDKAGKVLKEINVSGSGKGSVRVDGSTLTGGAYNYSLYVAGKMIDTKQMEILK
jgi:hypothetical protein